MSCVVIFGGIGFIGLSYAEKALKDPHIKKIFIFDINIFTYIYKLNHQPFPNHNTILNNKLLFQQ